VNFLLDTDTCSAHMRRPSQLAHRFIQYTGGLAIATIVLAELHAGAHKHPNPARLLALIAELLREVHVLDIDAACAERFGEVRGCSAALLQFRRKQEGANECRQTSAHQREEINERDWR
jgi:tRNA(fMet)-specific endonuclease VapC